MVSVGQPTSAQIENSVGNLLPSYAGRLIIERAFADYPVIRARSFPRLLLCVPDVGLHKFSLRFGDVESFFSFMGTRFLC